ncbi:hypothetical protein D3C81_223370 [compost metagenome]
MITVLGLLMLVLAFCLLLAYLQGYLWHGLPTAILCIMFAVVSAGVFIYGLEHETPGGLYHKSNPMKEAKNGVPLCS